MNCTSENTETANATPGPQTTQSSVPSLQSCSDSDWLTNEILARHIPVASQATPAEVIPWVHKFIKRHLKIGTQVPEGYESYKPWKATLDDWQAFLDKLQKLENPSFPSEPIAHEINSSAKNQPQTENAFANQRSAPDNEVRISENEVRKGENEVRIDEKILTSSENDSPQTTPTPPPPGADSKKQSTSTSSGADPVDLDDGENEDDENEDDVDEEYAEDEEIEDDDLDLAEYLDNESLEAALDLREHLAGRSPLDKLEPRIQQILLRLMEDHKPEHVAEAIAEPPPIGFGIQTSKASLYRFRERYTQAKEQSRKAQHAKAIQDLLAKAGNSEEAFQAAVQSVLKARLLTTTTEPNAPLDTIDALITTLNKLRKQSLAERKQLHAEKTK
jgi:hypothetical protein